MRVQTSRTVLALGLAACAAALTGCYVVPTNPYHAPTQVVIAAPAPPVPVNLAARLYPSNDLAQAYGVVTGVVSNDLNGRGTFSLNINGESFTGEATRVPGTPREGMANGAGNRGSFINCRYTMNSATLGAGTCRMSNGALFGLHVGN